VVALVERDKKPVLELSVAAGVAREGDPSWVLVGGATSPNKETFTSICRVIDDLLSDLKK
jgi:hypothetical protein